MLPSREVAEAHEGEMTQTHHRLCSAIQEYCLCLRPCLFLFVEDIPFILMSVTLDQIDIAYIITLAYIITPGCQACFFYFEKIKRKLWHSLDYWSCRGSNLTKDYLVLLRWRNFTHLKHGSWCCLGEACQLPESSSV